VFDRLAHYLLAWSLDDMSLAGAARKIR